MFNFFNFFLVCEFRLFFFVNNIGVFFNLVNGVIVNVFIIDLLFIIIVLFVLFYFFLFILIVV